MCIVADSVKNISKTKIASMHIAYTLDSGITVIPAQLVVYAANVDSSTQTNAFILPVYNPGNNYRKIIPLDFTKIPDFFNVLGSIYDRWFPRDEITAQAFGPSTNSYESKNILPVHKVGDYKFSIMPSKIDFNRLDRLQLNISPTAKTAVDMHSDDYSFIIYQFFQRGQIEITPFAYLCEPCREHAMIIPTIHGHPHDNVPTVGLGYVPNMFVSYNSDFEDTAEFDHEIYTLIKNPAGTTLSPKEQVTSFSFAEGITPIKKHDIIDLDKLLRKIITDYMNRNIRLYAPKYFIPNRINIDGYKLNRNILAKIDGNTFVRDLVTDQN